MQLLLGHLRGRPECRDVFEELALDAREAEAGESTSPKSRQAPVNNP
jgi:hypothetical protein